jgi:hypothetical protein
MNAAKNPDVPDEASDGLNMDLEKQNGKQIELNDITTSSKHEKDESGA